MRGSSRINRQEQVKVMIRLRPQLTQTKHSKSVYLSSHDENQLVVETDSKKEIFMFDHIAHEMTSQQEIYQMIGQECVQQTLEGYNCCIFAYGQTGAGKTYSVLGSQNDLQNDPYCPSRGILPRILQDTFQMLASRQERGRTKVTCSYLEIYNQQVFDLLSSDKRIHQIREDAKKGVFVEGMIEKRVGTYRNGIGLILQGEKTRKMASTMMNTQSSRSHVIFSILVQCQTTEQDLIKTKKAKLHIVDLAGSERVKHTNVEGQRLRQGCNINRSLHVLCNVINSLAESSKKKKHIPFRDSKLTHFLKDSLGGNSVTKLLANVHTGRQYFGDTLSTLMFAKRAKSVKMKVEMNQTTAENFDSLRREVRRLREELAQTRYFKLEGRISQRSTIEVQAQPVFQRVLTEPNQLQISGRSQILKTLQENQSHYKTLIQIYEQHMKTCLSSSNVQRKQNINIVKQWKNLEKRNISLTHLVKQIPSFTKIYKQNLLLKQERGAKAESIIREQSVRENSLASAQYDRKEQSIVNRETVEKIIDHYEKLLSEVQEKFRQSIDTLEKNYFHLENECRLKDKKIKDIKKHWQYPPDIEQLKNQNEYLHLSILNLQDEIKKLQQNQQKMKIELKQSKRSTAKKIQSKQEIHDEDQEQITMIYEKLQEIKHEAEKQSAQFDLERAQMQMMIHKLQAEINKYMVQNNRIRDKYSQKSKSKKKSPSKKMEDFHSVSHSNAKNHNMNSPNTKELFKSEIKYLTNSGVSMMSGTEDPRNQQQNYTKQLLVLKMEIKRKQKEVVDIKKQLDQYISGDKKIEDQFGKSLDQIIEEYRQYAGKRMLQQSKSVKTFQRLDEQKIPTKGRDSLKKEQPKKLLTNNYIK